jgi:hypothetical protein
MLFSENEVPSISRRIETYFLQVSYAMTSIFCVV